MILKWILLCYGKWFGFTINYHKRALIFLGEISVKSFLLSLIFNFSIKRLPITFLGLPLTTGRLNRPQWVPLIEKVQKRLVGWKGRWLSLGSRITMIIVVLSAIPTYFLSFSRSLDGWKGTLSLLKENFFGIGCIGKGRVSPSSIGSGFASVRNSMI